MRVSELALPGVYLVDIERLEDERGFFARTFSRDEFAGRGLVADFAQSSVSFNMRRGTVRGMHYSVAPAPETKLVRCTGGSICDVALDLRRGSPSYRRWQAVTLSARDHRALYIPVGVAHGFQTLADDTEVLYMIDPSYVAAAARGVRWNDPAFDIAWPEPISVISDKDLGFPDYRP